MKLILAVVFLLLGSRTVSPHNYTFTEDENAWLNRQFSVGGPRSGFLNMQHPSPVKCCDETDVHMGFDVDWRMNREGRYEVLIDGIWYPIPPDRMMNHKPDDRTPWPGRTLLFYSPSSNGPRIWCFFVQGTF